MREGGGELVVKGGSHAIGCDLSAEANANGDKDFDSGGRLVKQRAHLKWNSCIIS